MRILNTIIFSFLLCIGIQAQEFKVLSFKQSPMDLSASTHPRYDINNDAGALVKVLLAEPNVKFEGYIIGTPEYKNTEYWVYVTAGTKFLKIKAPNAIPLQVSFADNKLSPAQSKMTYELVLSRSGRAQKQTLAISFSPSSAIVLIDGKKYPSNNGKVVAMLPVGKHDFIVAADGYESYEGAVTLRESSPSNIQTTLPKSANADVSASIEHTKNIVDKVAEGKRFYDNKDYTAAYEIFKIEAETGNAEAQYYLGKCYYSGDGVVQDYIEAVKWFRKSADQGNARAQNNLGVCYFSGDGVVKDYTEAIKWYRKSAEQGCDIAQFNLGVRYEYGQGVAKDYTEAVKWYRKSAEQGNAVAQSYLGNCYYYGQGVAKDDTEAVKWYRKSAEQGNDNAQYSLGLCYIYGRGIAKDETETVKWWLKSAEHGHALAQFNLGLYYKKRGFAKDEIEAVKWWRKSAEQGYVHAQLNLGNCYYYGQGVAQGYTEAIKWYRKSAEQGNASAQNNLGNCYYYGRGVAQDYTEALKWYKKAAEQGNEKAKKKVETYPNW